MNLKFDDTYINKMLNKKLYTAGSDSLKFKAFIPEPEPISFVGLLINKITYKWDDLKAGCKIIFKGNYDD